MVAAANGLQRRCCGGDGGRDPLFRSEPVWNTGGQRSAVQGDAGCAVAEERWDEPPIWSSAFVPASHWPSSVPLLGGYGASTQRSRDSQALDWPQLSGQRTAEVDGTGSGDVSGLQDFTMCWHSRSSANGKPHLAPALPQEVDQKMGSGQVRSLPPVSYTHLRANETPEHLVCRLLLEKKK